MDMTRRQLVSTGLVTGLGVAVSSTLAARARAHDEQGSRVFSADSPLRLQMAIFEGVQPTDALAPFDVFTILGKVTEGAIESTLVTVNGEAEVIALGGLPLKPTGAFDPSADVFVVPGAPEVWRANVMPAGLPEAMAAFREPGKLLSTVCTGGVFAARAGFFQGRNATTHKAGLTVIEEQGAILQPGRVVDDGDLVSSGGSVSGLDLALYLVERFFGPKPAIQVETIIEYERRGTIWKA